MMMVKNTVIVLKLVDQNFNSGALVWDTQAQRQLTATVLVSWVGYLAVQGTGL